jgi:uncharacterized MAPEG superfamily protein
VTVLARIGGGAVLAVGVAAGAISLLGAAIIWLATCSIAYSACYIAGFMTAGCAMWWVDAVTKRFENSP